MTAMSTEGYIFGANFSKTKKHWLTLEAGTSVLADREHTRTRASMFRLPSALSTISTLRVFIRLFTTQYCSKNHYAQEA